MISSTVFNHLWGIKKSFKDFWWIFERFWIKFWEIPKICSNFANFWARKMFFFLKQVRISPEFDWFHYQGHSQALLGIVRHKTNRKPPLCQHYVIKCHNFIDPPPPYRHQMSEFDWPPLPTNALTSCVYGPFIGQLQREKHWVSSL